VAEENRVLEVLVKLRADTDKATKDIKANTAAVKELSSTTGKAVPGVAGLVGGLKGLAAQAAGLFGLHAALRFVAGAIREFADGEKAAAQLSATLNVMGADATALRPQINGLGDELKEFGFGQSQVDKAVTRFLFTLDDYSQAMKAARAAATLAAAGGMTLEEAVSQVSAAISGQVRGSTLLGSVMRRMNADMTDTANTGDRLALVLGAVDQLQGAADGSLDTFATSTQRLAVAWAEFKEQLAIAVNQLIDLPTVIGQVKNAILGLRTVLGLLDPDEQERLAIAGIGQQIEAKKKQLAEMETIAGRIKSAGSAGIEGAKTVIKDAVVNTVPDLLDGKILSRLYKDQTILGRAAGAYLGQNLVELTKSRKKAEEELAALEAKRDAMVRLRNAKNAQESSASAKAEADAAAAAEKRRLEESQRLREKFLADAAVSEAVASSSLAQKEMDLRLKKLAEEKEIELRLASGNLSKQLDLVREYADKEAAIRLKGSADITAAYTRAADAARAQLVKLTTVPVADLSKLAGDGGAFSDVLKLEEKLGLVTERNAEALGKMQKAFETWRDALRAARDASEALDADGQFRAFSERAALMREEVKRITDALGADVAQIEARNRIGAISGPRALRDTLSARTTAAEALTAVQREQLAELARLGESEASAEARRVLLSDIAELNTALANLKPTFEEQAQASDDFWEGMQIGAKQAAADAQTFGQLGAETVKTFEDGVASGGAQIFDDLISGAKSFGESARQVFSDLMRQIAQLIIQTLIYRAISSALGSFGGGAAAGANARAAAPGGMNFAGPGFAEGGVIEVGTGPTADDVPILVSKGEGIVNARAVRQYGAPVIHALNTLSIPRSAFAGIAMPSMPQMPMMRFASGGVVGDVVRGQRSDVRDQMPVVLNNVVAIGDSEARRLFSSSAFKDAVKSEITHNGGHIERTVRGKRGFRDD
jgi:hypothetical protein